MTYQAERDRFIDRMAREGLPLAATHTLLRCATTIHRLAELACSSEAADRDRIPCPGTNGHQCLCDDIHEHTSIPRITLQDYHAKKRAKAAIPKGWIVVTQGDPRGYTLRVIPPSYAARNKGRDGFNLDVIGVPARPSRLRF